MSKTSLALLGMFLIVLGILIALNTIYTPNSVLHTFGRAMPTQQVASENTLSMSPNTVTITAGRTASIDVLIDSFGEKPSVIQMELAYDPGSVGNVKLKPGGFFEDPEVVLSKINPRTGRISYAVKSGSNSTKEPTSHVVATLTFTPFATARKQSTFEFLPKTTVKTKATPDTLKNAYGATLFITNSGLPSASESGLISQ